MMMMMMDEQVSSDVVRILVSHVSLIDGPILYDDTITMLFVDFSFLDIPIKDTETPYSLPKPTTPDKNIMFNFSKGMISVLSAAVCYNCYLNLAEFSNNVYQC